MLFILNFYPWLIKQESEWKRWHVWQWTEVWCESITTFEYFKHMFVLGICFGFLFTLFILMVLWDFEQFLLSLLPSLDFDLDFACLPFFLILGNCGFWACEILAAFLLNFGFSFSTCPLLFQRQSGNMSEIFKAWSLKLPGNHLQTHQCLDW